MPPIVSEIVELIALHGWQPTFSTAIELAQAHGVQQMAHITSVDAYLRFASASNTSSTCWPG